MQRVSRFLEWGVLNFRELRGVPVPSVEGLGFMQVG